MTRHRLLLLAVAVALLPLAAACTTVIHPPASPADPVEVYLLDHGRTPSLVLPVLAATGDSATVADGMLRYAYGDWRWYALERKTSGHGVAALLWPTLGALGRQALAGPPGEAAVRAGVEVEIETLHPLTVEAAEVAALAARLDALFRGALETRVEAPGSGLSFVHHPEPYTFLHSSNRVVAEWLRELGCRVRGTALLSRWRLGPAARRRRGGRRLQSRPRRPRARHPPAESSGEPCPPSPTT